MTSPTKAKNALGYDEKKDHLSIRIEAHKRFSNFSLEDWLGENLSLGKGQTILDIGCGDGNFFAIYSQKLGKEGVIVGIDKSPELLARAQDRPVATSKLILHWDINQPFPFIGESFDYVISTFAIYYVDETRAILEEIRRVLKPQGEVLLIGPSDNNAGELYAYNQKVFGFGRDEKISQRTNRLEQEFYPAMKSLFKPASMDVIPSQIQFPSQEEFLKYYLATLLYEESAQKAGSRPSLEALKAIVLPAYVISKEMIALRGKKSG
jgi:ubiquinone/menaquinone biosynthesis C-methylase UbiE